LSFLFSPPPGLSHTPLAPLRGHSLRPTTGAEGRAGEPTEGSPQGDTSGAREATSASCRMP
jgi:hypothetical protein